jgi:uncharacterized protein YqcC (DUF446 family)
VRALRTEVAATLIDIEAQLRQLNLWDREPPAPEALASREPFAFDTLTLPQWLQFIFLPTLYTLLEEQRPLPEACAITPMAEEYFRGSGLAIGSLLEALDQIDALLSGDIAEPG